MTPATLDLLINIGELPCVVAERGLAFAVTQGLGRSNAWPGGFTHCQLFVSGCPDDLRLAFGASFAEEAAWRDGSFRLLGISDLPHNPIIGISPGSDIGRFQLFCVPVLAATNVLEPPRLAPILLLLRFTKCLTPC